jgi:UDP-GlcNAc:undecaprenyl-phosphate GlcNAc-1-phosphate transferase
MAAALLALSSFVLSVCLVPLMRDLARSRGWVDQPDNVRKSHAEPTPRLGGVAVGAACLGSLGGALLVLPENSTLQSFFTSFWKLVPASAAIFVVGVLDDFFNLKAWQKLCGQILAAILAYAGGIQIHAFGNSHLSSFMSAPVTIVWLVACANAFNLIDGMDGLAGGLGLLASLATCAAGFLYHDARLTASMAPLAGALLGFLIFNFSPASIFLGDCGSLWIGFILGCFAVIWSNDATTTLGAVAPLVALCIPLLDTAISITRRFLRRYPIFCGDRGHIHHRLLDRGMTPRSAAWGLYGAGALGGGLSFLQSLAWKEAGIASVLVFLGLTRAGIHYLGYSEFGIARRLLWGLRSLVQSRAALADHEERLRKAASVEDCWQAIRQVGRDYGFSHVVLRLCGRTFDEHLGGDIGPEWALEVPLPGSDFVRFRCGFETSDGGFLVAPLTDVLRQALSKKAAELGGFLSPIARKPMAQAAAAAGREPNDLRRSSR